MTTVAELRDLLAKATPGPWTIDDFDLYLTGPAGDPPESVADDYDVSVDAVNQLVAYAAERSRQHRARWPGLQEEAA